MLKASSNLSLNTSRVQKISAEALVADQTTQCHRWDRGKYRLRSTWYLSLREWSSCGKDVNPGYFTCSAERDWRAKHQQNGIKLISENGNKEKLGVFGFTTADGKVN